MTGPVARTLTCAALALAGSGWARAQQAPGVAPPPATLLTEEAEQAHETAPVVLDGGELLRVGGFSGCRRAMRPFRLPDLSRPPSV
jgi:hypothetical protein